MTEMAKDARSDHQGDERDYLFYVLPSSNLTNSTTAGGLCWLEASQECETKNDTNPNEVRLALPKLVTAPPSHHAINIVSEKIIPFVQPSADSLDTSTSVDWHVIWNPAAGKRRAKAWLEQLVIPLLTFAGARFKVHETSLPTTNDSKNKNVHQDIFSLTPDQAKPIDRGHPKVILMGGDGTTYDFLNQITTYDPSTGKPIIPSFELLIIPLGTANALFFSAHPSASDLNKPRNVLRSLLLALFSTTAPPSEQVSKTLQLAHVRVFDSDHQLTHQAIAHVVISTALHAAILHTADQLRDSPEFEGSSRFFEAFKRNNTRLWKASLLLLPITSPDSGSSSSILRYEPDDEKFITISESDQDTLMEGEFSYFTSCLIDRLEANFVIAPMRSSLTYESNHSIDIVVLRPKRDIRMKDLVGDELGTASAHQVTEVMSGASNSGHHLQLTLPDGQPTVEYFRCGGWEWRSSSPDQEVCIDGMLIKIPENGSVQCAVINNTTHRVIMW
ncbi:uncharacterized protein MELLADRAFT_115838 [Melampsora larici-populina 98AG31]|uniref:DAGKc domain-containing protein n=1 Tax=Melampsora larici-populina (strain 98AG31 / pathotype 3-4-7) TaxID=747676 RepID=F4RER4_MELLP|nr:uncharacterized protein MELLADRAFT_115838 [Melampsora larici-populina 98AG31]EGG09146.1 hypothetical protein MELLADRAFT_115838 [Melampsora larici-populina 98AG31]